MIRFPLVMAVSEQDLSELSLGHRDRLIYRNGNSLYDNQQGTNYVWDIVQRHLFTNNNLCNQNVLDK